MVNPNSQSTGVWYDGIAIVRIVVGVILIFHGWQLFETNGMNEFADRLLDLAIPFPEFMVYAGKIVELVGGIFLIFGLFTRLMTALLFLTFIFITFVMGDGKIFTDNQHPFLLAMFSLLFFFTGAGRFSFDYVLFINRKEENKDSDISVSKRFGRYVSKN
jgi:uncharacterized membrane protein YphA (DoxX/SURF4 family)